MKRAAIFFGLCGAVWMVAQVASTPKPLAEITPAGAVLYLEARNFQSLLADWNSSREKTEWAGSANYQVFSRSRLYLRLSQVFDEYASGIGIPPDLTLLQSIAGGESALAIYDINNLEFLFVTRLPSAKAMESVLLKSKEKFETRAAAGVTYYVKSDGKRTAAFAATGELLLLATRESALGGALALLNGAGGTPIRREVWFDDAVKSAAAAGELRLVLNMEQLVRSPAFRSYWVQRNVTELAGYRTAIDDLHRTSASYREDRVLLRGSPVTPPSTDGVSELSRLIPSAAGVYRIQAQPDLETVLDILTRKVLRPAPATYSNRGSAPAAAVETPSVGDENDLEGRIDGAPFSPAGAIYRPEGLRTYLQANPARAVATVHFSRSTADRVFVTNDAVVAIAGTNDWDSQAATAAVHEAIGGLYTTAKLGLTSGLARVSFRTQGKLLLIGTADGPVNRLLSNTAQPSAASYLAGYRLQPEIANYRRLMGLIEFPSGGNSNEPAFFSENLGSLAETMRRIASVAIVSQDNGREVRQSVAYRFAP